MREKCGEAASSRFGSVPCTWHKAMINEICRMSSGSTPRRDNANNFNGTILWVSSGELKKKFVLDTNEKISQEAARASHLKMYEPGAVVAAIYGLEAAGIRGTASIIKKQCTIRQACMAFTDFKGIDNEFFYYWYILNGPRIGHRYAQGTKQQNLSSEIVGTLQICFPPLPEQRKIAAILATQDKVSELKTKLLEGTKRRKKALMQRLLALMGEKRREVASPRGEAASCRFSAGWQIVRLSDLFLPVNRKNAKNNKNILTISAQDGLVSQMEYYKHQYASADTSGYTLLKEGEFAYNKSRAGEFPYGAIKMLKKYEEGVVSPIYLCFAAKKGVCQDFWSYYFNGGMVNHGLYRIAQEGVRNHGLLNIPTDEFFNLELRVPPIAVQRRIVAVLSTADREIDLMEKELNALELKKKALMQLLLTGIVRVREAASCRLERAGNEAAGSRFSTRIANV